MTLKNKIVSADEAIAIIRDGDTICVSGFVGIGTPDELILALERRFLKEGHPSNSLWSSPPPPAMARTGVSIVLHTKGSLNA
jgi:propionate CoA-transferase